MKKLFSKVSAFVLAFMMIFALGACGDNTNMVDVKSSGEALTGAADAMLKQDGMTVTLDGGISMLGKMQISQGAPAIALNAISLDGSFKMAKKEKDIDFDAQMSVSLAKDADPMTFNAVKVGNKMYSKSVMSGGQWATEPAKAVEMPAALPAQVTDMLKSLDLGKLEKGKESYRLTASLDYGAPLKKLQSFIKDNETKTLTEVLFPELNDTQRAELKTKLNGLVEDLDTATVPAFIAKVDAILDYVKGSGEAKTVKGLADSLFAQAGITAQSLRDMIVNNLPENSEFAQLFPQPAAGQTAYDYVLSLIPPQMTVGAIADMIGGMIGGGSAAPDQGGDSGEGDGQQTEQGGGMESYYAMLVEALTSKDEAYKIPALYDMISLMAVGMIYESEMGGYLDMVLSMIADAEVAAKLSLEKGETYISWVNLKNMVFGDNKAELTAEFNGSDLTLKSIKIVVKNDIKLKTSDTKTEQLTKVDININVNFAYGAVTVAAPEMPAQAA